MFKIVGLVTKPNNKESKQIAKQLVSFLHELNITTLFYHKTIKDRAEIIIILGGDGTFVATARTYVDCEIPLLGVNLGHLGFLTDIDTKNMFESIKLVLSGRYNIEKRFMLECTLNNQKFTALNDVVIHRSNAPRMVNSRIDINGVFVNNGLADGLIISTPTGSTAYALSSGGPIINLGVEAMSLVYISPHAMTYRPFIFSADDELTVSISEPKTGANIIIDGQVVVPIDSKQKIYIHKYHQYLKLIHPHDYDFFSILRNKLHWNK